MYYDESQIYLVESDRTQNDLETKSILKPAKQREPLKEVDLGLQINTEQDVIRKRRVSFAGVNKIKEFHSKSESVIILRTPAYEETFSLSSDSSATTDTAGSGSNNSHYGFDSNLLNDTMELTDLEISSNMDFTSVKPNGLVGVAKRVPQVREPDLLEMKGRTMCYSERVPPKTTSPDDSTISNLNSNNMVLDSERPTERDPIRLLVNELLEESGIDFPETTESKSVKQDKRGHINLFLGGNSPSEKNTDPTTSNDSFLAASEIEFTVAIPIFTNRMTDVSMDTARKCATANSSKYLDNGEKVEPIDTRRPEQVSAHFVVNNSRITLEHKQEPMMDLTNYNMPIPCDNSMMSSSYMEFTEAIPSNVRFQLENTDSNRQINITKCIVPDDNLKITGSDRKKKSRCSIFNPSGSILNKSTQMDITENPTPTNEYRSPSPLLDSVIPSSDLNSNPLKMKVPSENAHPININYGKLDLLDTSQMDFTEALAPKTFMYDKNVKISAFSQPSKILQADMSSNIYETSQLEFTEALRPHAFMTDKVIKHSEPTKVRSSPLATDTLFNSVSKINDITSNICESVTMDITKAILPNSRLNAECDSYNHLQKTHVIDQTEVIPTTVPSPQVSKIEFTETLPNLQYDHYPFPALNQNRLDKSYSDNTYLLGERRAFELSQMDFTEALPRNNIENYKVAQSQLENDSLFSKEAADKSVERSSMELTVASAPLLFSSACKYLLHDNLSSNVAEEQIDQSKAVTNQMKESDLVREATDPASDQSSISDKPNCTSEGSDAVTSNTELGPNSDKLHSPQIENTSQHCLGYTANDTCEQMDISECNNTDLGPTGVQSIPHSSPQKNAGPNFYDAIDVFQSEDLNEVVNYSQKDSANLTNTEANLEGHDSGFNSRVSPGKKESRSEMLRQEHSEDGLETLPEEKHHEPVEPASIELPHHPSLTVSHTSNVQPTESESFLNCINNRTKNRKKQIIDATTLSQNEMRELQCASVLESPSVKERVLWYEETLMQDKTTPQCTAASITDISGLLLDKSSKIPWHRNSSHKKSSDISSKSSLLSQNSSRLSMFLYSGPKPSTPVPQKVSKTLLSEETKTNTLSDVRWAMMTKNQHYFRNISFEFGGSPVIWTYKFSWDLELVLKIPEEYVNGKTPCKGITLLTSTIPKTAVVRQFVYDEMKKRMCPILTENWMNSNCKLLTDLLATLKIIEDKRKTIDPIVKQLKYLYIKHPFIIINCHNESYLQLQIIHIQKQRKFELKINLSRLSKITGNDIKAVNIVGKINETEMKRIFEQLENSVDKFHVFLKKLQRSTL